jgi:flagellar basal body-associated protein FliL
MSKAPRDIKSGRAPKKAPQPQSKLVTAVVATAFVTTIVSASAVILFQKFMDPGQPAAKIEPQTPVAPKYDSLVYYDFPKLTVYLKQPANTRTAALANIRVSAEFTDAAPLQSTKMAQPRIVDAMQSYLRECSREQLDGRQGTDMLRQAFLNIVNDAIVPHHANTVLFREIVIQ